MTDDSELEYRGTLVLPGEQEARAVSISMNIAENTVQVRFEQPGEGKNNWDGSNVKLARRLKYNEAVFSTTGLPMDPVQLTWKFNASILDDSLAGVIIPRPNAMRVTGERGFILSKVP